MSEMLENVAWAIAEKVAETNFVGMVNQGGLTGADMQAFFTVFARAAIEAMREPTPDMALAGLGSHAWTAVKEGATAAESATRSTYRAMIDAALGTTSSVER